MNIGIDSSYIILAIITAAAAGLVGSFALMRKMVLAGDVISHIALPGLGLAFLFKINPLLGGAATLLLGILLIWQLEKKTGLTTEATIGVVFVVSLAIGVLITPSEDLIEALFGGFQNLDFAEFLIGLLAGLGIIIFVLKFKNELVFGLFSPDLARTSGLNVERLNLYFLLIFGLTIILGLRFLGALLVGSLIIIPAAASRQLTHKFSLFLIFSSIISALSIAIGLILFYVYGFNLGPTTAIIASLIFFLALLKKQV